MFLDPKGVLKYVEESNLEYYERLRDVFLEILMNDWFFWVPIVDLEFLEREDSEYIRIFWIFYIG